MLASPGKSRRLFPAYRLFLACVWLWGGSAWGEATPRLTPAAAGPYKVSGSRILDAKGQPYLIRGTELPTLTEKPADFAGDGNQFGAFSPSSMVSIRQRLNMNAVMLPLSPGAYEESADYRARAAEVVRSANRFELLAILAADPGERVSPAGLAHFWTRCASDFKNHANVFFAPGGGGALVDAVRAGGAEQPVLAGMEYEGHDPNAIYEATPSYAATRTDEDRWREFGQRSTSAPVLVRGMDPQLDRKSAECAAFPGDPGAATKMVQASLEYFDAHGISWVLSEFRPGKMLTEYRYYNWSKLDDGWVCGETPSRSGIAMILAAHLWSADPHGLFVVNHVNGGMRLARGGLATAYGPILADREMAAPAGRPLPLRLGNVSVRVKDSRGTARMARLEYTGAGWANISFIVPEEAAAGPAEIAVVRTDGSSSRAMAIIADVAPGFFTAYDDARGAVAGEVVQQAAGGGPAKKFVSAACGGGECRTVPIPLSSGWATTVRLMGSGIRNAGPDAKVRVTVGSMEAPVVSFGAADGVGRDQVTIRLPAELAGTGETDLVATVNGELTNVVRIHCGGL